VRRGGLTALMASRAERLEPPELLACLTALLGPLDGGGVGGRARQQQQQQQQQLLQQHVGDEEILSGEGIADRVLGLGA
jgi:hypothetical protein